MGHTQHPDPGCCYAGLVVTWGPRGGAGCGVVTRHQQLTVYTVTRCDHRQPAPAPPHAPAAAAAAGEQRTQRNLLRRGGARHLDTWLQWIHRTAVTSFLIISPATCPAATVLYSQFLPGNDEWLPNDPSCRAICLRLAQLRK